MILVLVPPPFEACHLSRDVSYDCIGALLRRIAAPQKSSTRPVRVQRTMHSTFAGVITFQLAVCIHPLEAGQTSCASAERPLLSSWPDRSRILGSLQRRTSKLLHS